MKLGKVGAVIFFCLLFFAGRSACADSIRLAVPYVGGGGVKNSCGLASLAMTANYWGRNLTVAELAGESSSKTPVSSLEITRLAGRQCLWAYPYRGNIRDIKTKLQSGIPLIVLLDFGLGPLSIAHYAVVTGFNPEKRVVYFHTTWKRDSFLSASSFEFFWGRAGYVCLLVVPPEKINFPLTAEENNSLGLFYLSEGNPEQAAASFLQALKMEDNFLYRFNLAVSLAEAGKKEEAKELYRKVLAESDFGPAYNNLAEILLEEDAGEAEYLARKAIARDPSRQAYYLDTLGRALILQGNMEEGKEMLQKALQDARCNFPEIASVIEERLNK